MTDHYYTYDRCYKKDRASNEEAGDFCDFLTVMFDKIYGGVINSKLF